MGNGFREKVFELTLLKYNLHTTKCVETSHRHLYTLSHANRNLGKDGDRWKTAIVSLFYQNSSEKVKKN